MCSLLNSSSCCRILWMLPWLHECYLYLISKQKSCCCSEWYCAYCGSRFFTASVICFVLYDGNTYFLFQGWFLRDGDVPKPFWTLVQWTCLLTSVFLAHLILPLWVVISPITTTLYSSRAFPWYISHSVVDLALATQN